MANTDEAREKVFGFILPDGVDGTLAKQTVLIYITLIFMTMMFLIFVLPRFADLVSLEGKVNGIAKSEESLNKASAALDSFKTQVPSGSTDLVYLAIPSRFDPGLILLSLRKVAADNHVSLISYSLAGGNLLEKKGGATNQLVTHQVKVSISGSTQSLISFVDGLDKYLPVVSVTDLSISEISKIFASGTADLKLDLNLSYYHLPISVSSSGVLSSEILTDGDVNFIKSLSGYSHLTTTQQNVTPVTSGGKEKLFGF